MRISDWSSDVCSSDLTVREVPGGTRELPSEALGLAGGGTIAVDPTDASGRKALNRIFLLDVSLPRALENIQFGTRVHVRLLLAWEPIGWQNVRPDIGRAYCRESVSQYVWRPVVAVTIRKH